MRVRTGPGRRQDLGISASHQVIDTPLVTAAVTQYDEHMAECACGRCAEIIASLSGTRPSDGFVHAMLARAANAVRAVNMLIRALVITAAMICADETPIRQAPARMSRKKYLLVACTSLLTYYFLGDRSMATFDGFVFPDFSGVIVHDRYQNYDSIPGVIHQFCCQHLLRDIEDAAKSYPDAIWPGQAADALRSLIHAANTARVQGLAAVPDDVRAKDLRLFRNAVRVGLSEVRRIPGANKKQLPARLLLECLEHREHDILRFLDDLRIPPTSNEAERDLRPAKTQQDLRPPPLRRSHPPPVRHPWLHIHRRQARRRHHHSHPRRPCRKPLDAPHHGHRLTLHKTDYAAPATITRTRWPECLRSESPNERHRQQFWQQSRLFHDRKWPLAWRRLHV